MSDLLNDSSTMALTSKCVGSLSGLTSWLPPQSIQIRAVANGFVLSFCNKEHIASDVAELCSLLKTLIKAGK